MLGIDFKKIESVGNQVMEFVVQANLKMKTLNDNDHALMRELKIIEAQNNEILRMLAIRPRPNGVILEVKHDGINGGGN